MSYQPGDILLDKYRIEELIGRGSFAEVYCATHIDLNRPRALKVLRKDAPGVGPTTLREFEYRFRLEARLGDLLDHPNLIQIYDIGIDGEELVLVMEYAPGGNLAERISVAKDMALDIPLEKVIQYATDIALGLAEIHKQDIVHRDLKPSNILFDSQGRAKVADLGLAQTAESTIDRYHGGSISLDHPGTPEYMPPEQQPGNKMALNVTADIFALGCVIFEMLTGRRYYHQKPNMRARDLRSDIPIWLDDLVNQMLSKDMNDRPWDGSEAAELIRKKKKTNRFKRLLEKIRKFFRRFIIDFWYLWIILLLAIIGWRVFSAINLSRIFPAAEITSTATVENITPTVTILPPTKTPTATITETNTRLPTFTSTPSQPSTSTATPQRIAVVTSNEAYVRSGDGTSFRAAETYYEGDELKIIGINEDTTWLAITLPFGKSGWIALSRVNLDFDVTVLPIIESPSTPTPGIYTLSISNTMEESNILIYIDGIKQSIYVNEIRTYQVTGGRHSCSIYVGTGDVKPESYDNTITFTMEVYNNISWVISSPSNIYNLP